MNYLRISIVIILIHVLMSNAFAFTNVCNRTTQVKNIIVKTLKKECNQINIEDLKLIKTFSYDYDRNLTNLQPNDFEGLTELEKISITNTKITTLPARIFKDNKQIVKLQLGYNAITSLPEDIFQGLGSLQQVSLVYNNLTSISDKLFKDLVNLKSISLHTNPNLVLTDNLFQNNLLLESIELNNCKITSLPTNLFKKLTNLKKLYLYSNLLTTLPDAIFEDLISLTSLRLDSNKIEILSESIFRNSPLLKSVDIFTNLLKTLPENIFANNLKLESLRFQNNQIQSLPTSVFNRLTELTELYLHENQLVELPEGVFDNLIKLKSLSLNQNKLIKIPLNTFNYLSSLTVLILDDNQINELPDAFDRLKSISQLYLNNNKINKIPYSLFKVINKTYNIQTKNNPIEADYYNVFNTMMSYDFPNSCTEVKCIGASIQNASQKITQMEDFIPLAMKLILHDVTHYSAYYDFIYSSVPSYNGDVSSLNSVRQLAVDVCKYVKSFCPTREQIHAFPIPAHLEALNKLIAEIENTNIDPVAIVKAKQLRESLKRFFNQKLIYTDYENKVPLELNEQFKQLFLNLSNYDLMIQAIETIENSIYLNKDNVEWTSKYFHPLMQIKLFLVNRYKQYIQQLSTDKSNQIQNLIRIAKAQKLLSNREISQINQWLISGENIKAIENSIEWQKKKLENLWFSDIRLNIENLPFESTQKSELLSSVNSKLYKAYEVLVRTSFLAEWNSLLN